MKTDRSLWGSISILVGAVIAILALVRGTAQAYLLIGVFSLWGLWVVGILLLPHRRQAKRLKERRRQQKERQSEGIAPKLEPLPTLQDMTTEQLLLHHVNHRISAYLKAAYPDVTWEWCEKNPGVLIRNGGVGRIRVFGVSDFGHADITMDQQANINCDMVRIVPLAAAAGGSNGAGPIPPNKQPVDPQIWYEIQGRKVLEALVTDLNSRGHNKLILREDGDICVEEENNEVAKEHLSNFPEAVYWPRLVQVLESNGLAAEITAKGISVSW